MPIKAWLRSILSKKAVGIPTLMLLRLLGLNSRARRVSQLCQYVPPVVVFSVSSQSGTTKTLKLDSCKGAGQFARGVYWLGWDKIEQSTACLYFIACRRARTVFDVGANTGFYSILACGANENSTVHSFEPFPPALEVLHRNVQLNNGESRILVRSNAVGEDNKTVQLYVPTGNHGLIEASCSLSPTFRHEHASILNVPMLSLDQYATDQKLSEVDVIKIDVESQEHRVLRGAQHIMSNMRPLIFLEVLESCDVIEIRKIHKAHHYGSFAILDGKIQAEDMIDTDRENRNHILCPRERTSFLEEYCREAYVNVTMC